MAQLGDLVRAKALLRRAARAFGPKEAVARARCIVAEAEIALVSRDLGWPAKALDAARATLEAHGDRVNAAHARYLEVRRLLLIGRLDEAERTLAQLDPALLPARVADRPRAGGRGDRDAAPPDEGGARCARARRARRAPRRYPRADGGGRERVPRPEHARRAPDRERRGAAPPARRGRSVAGVEGLRRGRVPSCRARRAARWSRSPGVRCCSRSHARWAKRGRATSRGTRSSRAPSDRSIADRIASRAAARRGRAASHGAADAGRA